MNYNIFIEKCPKARNYALFKPEEGELAIRLRMLQRIVWD